MIAARPIDALRLIDRGRSEGSDGVLVTLVGIEGSSSRAVGTQIAVLADGRSVGSFSGGCIERAIIAEALDVLAAGTPRLIRYGVGSPYIDVRLPCGGGIDLLFTPRPDHGAITAVLSAHARRDVAAIDLGSHRVTYPPALRLVALGHGEDLVALVRLARAYGVDVAAFAPATDAAPEDAIAPIAARDRFPDVMTDAWSAIVFLFHDRDWEEFLLAQALDRPAFYHGAVGSRRTQAARIAHLAQRGATAADIDRLRASVGLIPATRNPGALALSILADVVQDYEALAQTVVTPIGARVGA